MTERRKTKQDKIICYLTFPVYYVLPNYFLKIGLVISEHSIHYLLYIFILHLQDLNSKKQIFSHNRNIFDFIL